MEEGAGRTAILTHMREEKQLLDSRASARKSNRQKCLDRLNRYLTSRPTELAKRVMMNEVRRLRQNLAERKKPV